MAKQFAVFPSLSGFCVSVNVSRITHIDADPKDPAGRSIIRLDDGTALGVQGAVWNIDSQLNKEEVHE